MAGDVLADPRRRVVGVKETLKRIGADAVGQVYVAADASPKIVEPVLKLAEAKKIPVSPVDTMKLLGQRCGIQVGAACAGVLKTAADGQVRG